MLRRSKSARCCVRHVGRSLGLVVLLLLSVLAGCGGDDDEDDKATTGGSAAANSACGNRADFASGPELNIIGLTADQRLVRFQECSPRQVQAVGRVSGLQAPDNALVGIDFRVQDGQLYGLGNGGGVYTLNLSTAQATFVNALTVSLVGTFFGVDFNPAANALRIISDTGQNLRQPFAGALAGQTQTDTPLNYPGPPLVSPATGLSGAAYTNNDLDANTGTTLFNIDTALNQVVIQSPPNAGALVATGSLTVDPDTSVGFDIYSRLRDGVAITNSGFASLVVGGVSGFYRINLVTGQAILIDSFGEAMLDIAIPLNQN
jgi:uncharacterized protein DUF4394